MKAAAIYLSELAVFLTCENYLLRKEQRDSEQFESDTGERVECAPLTMLRPTGLNLNFWLKS